MRLSQTLVLAIALLTPLQLPAQSGDDGIVSVSGSASVERPPDLAVVRVGIETQAEEASEAQRAANRVAAAILDSIGELGVPEDAIQTSRLQLFPVYETPQPGPARGGERRVTGYRATNAVSVSLEDLEKIGPVVDAAIDSGANRIDSVDLRLEDDAEARREALAGAVLDARDKAETIARALGHQLGSVVEVVEGGVSAPPVYLREAAIGRMAADSGATPVATGRLTVSASVTVRYRLGPAE